MITGRTDYNEIIDFIKRYEIKYQNKISIRELIKYIQTMRGIKLELAEKYVHDLAKLQLILIAGSDIELPTEKAAK